MLARPFQRLAIVNRGEAAMRAIRALRELGWERPDPIRIIALYTEPDRHALFVRQADERHCLGPATREDGPAGYLDYAAVERALTVTRADAVWVGWGFVAEHPAFAELCQRLGVVFVGPDPEVMRALGDKIEGKRLAERAGVPVAPWSGGSVDTVGEAIRHSEALGFPLMIKAAAGGGGRGMRRVEGSDELAHSFERARTEAQQSFGDSRVLMERVVGSARHVEVQLIADGHGAVWALGVRDCSYQRRHQKVVEESASPALSGDQERELAAAAVRLAELTGYRGAATVEFLYEPADRVFSFMEVNTRLQVEHPVTEMVTGVDLVKLQLHVAAGGRLLGDPPSPSGHAIEVRLNAEDPALGFAPAPGRVALLRLPGGPGVRVDTGVAEGDVVPSEFDSMIAKIIAHGRTRQEAVARLRRALADTMVLIEGGATNQGFLLELLGRAELLAGEADTGWLDRLQVQGEVKPTRHADVALVRAAIELYDHATAEERARFYAFARRGRPEAGAELRRTIDLRYGGAGYRFGVSQVGPYRYLIDVDGARIEAELEYLSQHERLVSYGGGSYRTLTALQDADLLVEVDGVPHRVSRDEGGLIRSLGPGVVVAIPVSPGDEVHAGDVVAVTESMKMESSITSPVDGRVRDVLVSTNTQVASGRPLLQIEALDEAGLADDGDRLRFDVGDTGSEHDSNLERIKWLLLGYDVTPDEVTRLLERQRTLPADLEAERHLLGLYADVRALSRPHPADAGHAAEVASSPEQQLHAFLRTLDAGEESFSDRFVTSLERALAHYGINSLERTAALEAACYRLFLSRQRARTAGSAIRVLLDRQLEQAARPAGVVGSELRDLLDRVEAALAPSEPDLAELAREVRWRCCDQPVIQQARQDVYATIDEHLAALGAGSEEDERGAHIRALVECSQPLDPLLFRRRAADAPPAVTHALLEALTRRHYRARPVQAIERHVIDGRPWTLTRFDHGGSRHCVGATLAEAGKLRGTLGALSTLAAAAPDGEQVVADVYAPRAGLPVEPDQLASALRACLAQFKHAPALARVTFILAGPEPEADQVDVITFAQDADGTLAEDREMLGLHPMTAERMDLWRLANFALERIVSNHDLNLFRAVAHANPRDERLVAVAEVRDLAPVRDERGRIVALPELERVARQCFEAMRTAQLRRPPRERPHWNRVMLYAWPITEFDPEEARPVITRLARESAGLGLEMVLLRVRTASAHDREDEVVLRFFNPAGRGVVLQVDPLPTQPLQPLDEGAQRIVSARRRGLVHPAEILKVLAPGPGTRGATIPPGEFSEYDLDAHGDLVAITRPHATNRAGVVVGLVRNSTERYPEGMERVILLGDPTRSLGSLAEPECRRIIAALDLADRRELPCEWFAVSAGAKIAIDSGTENMDWVAAVLRRIVRFTQSGGEINLVVSGINVGAQPYWNAEATMLMHTKGVLIMTPESAMVLTGKQALDYSGGVSAEDNIGIGGHERIMGPNGQAQYWAPDIAGACETLLTYYEHSYVAPGERFPRRANTADPSDRDVSPAPHWAPGLDLQTVGEIFSEVANPGRKKPFDIRSVMRAAVDADHPPLERWKGLAEGEAAVTWDAHLGGWPVMMLGIESRPLPRRGPVPADGPEQWTSGTLFPLGSKKIARSINAASGRRPLVVLANLAGFDGSPESMRRLQLEYGAEIGRAVVNFDGPIAFCVISRFHGGAFVVFSRALNENLETSAIEGSYASVIGGAPAAAVVFSRDVDRRTGADPRIAELDERIAQADDTDRRRELRSERAARWAEVRAEKLGQFAAEFDAIHSIERAVEVGSVERIIRASDLRPYLIDAVERGMRRTLGQLASGNGRPTPSGALPGSSVR